MHLHFKDVGRSSSQPGCTMRPPSSTGRRGCTRAKAADRGRPAARTARAPEGTCLSWHPGPPAPSWQTAPPTKAPLLPTDTHGGSPALSRRSGQRRKDSTFGRPCEQLLLSHADRQPLQEEVRKHLLCARHRASTSGSQPHPGCLASGSAPQQRHVSPLPPGPGDAARPHAPTQNPAQVASRDRASSDPEKTR